MAALARIPLLCAIAGLCSVACHAPGHRRHEGEPPRAEQEDVWGDVEAAKSSRCARRSRVVHVGHGMFGYGIELDVGRCEKSYHINQKFEPSSEDLDDSSSEQACPSDYSCLPASSTLQRVYTRHGVQEVSVVDACRCEEAPAACTRTDHVVLLYPGTPFETRLDVGSCAGHCREGGCRPTRNRTVSLPGPGGSSCHAVVEECGCEQSCYRVSSEETVYDYGNVGNDTEDAEPEIKLIDVGRCVGSCSAGHAAASRCLLRDRQDPRRCLSALYNKRAACEPHAFRLHSFVTKERDVKEVVVVTACKCG